MKTITKEQQGERSHSGRNYVHLDNTDDDAFHQDGCCDTISLKPNITAYNIPIGALHL
jgi:hypothetical protein